MENNINFRDYCPADKSKVFALLSSFYANISNEKSWENTYMDNPDGRAIISVAESLPQKKIIGHYSVIKMPMVVLKDRYLGGKGEGEIFDLSAIKELLHEGKPLNKSYSSDLLIHTLDSALKAGIKLVCTNPSDLALKSHLDAGFKIIKQRFDIFVFIFKSRYAGHLLSDKINFNVLRNIAALIFSAIFNLSFKINSFLYRNSRIALEDINSFNDETDRLAKRFSDEIKYIGIERSQKHLNWRFGADDYKKIVIKFNEKIIGYIVLHIFINVNGFKEANIVDYLIVPSQWDKFPVIITETLKMVKSLDCDFLRLNYMYDIKERFGVSNILKRLHFLNRTDRRNIVVFLSPELEKLKDRITQADNWYFTDLYFENY